jgi:hypothetical protein
LIEVINEHDEGDLVRASAAFTNTAGTATDPAVVKFRFKAPSAATYTEYIYLTDAQLVKASTGNYYVDLDTTGEPGIWKFRFYSTGSGQAAEQKKFKIIRKYF